MPAKRPIVRWCRATVIAGSPFGPVMNDSAQLGDIPGLTQVTLTGGAPDPAESAERRPGSPRA